MPLPERVSCIEGVREGGKRRRKEEVRKEGKRWRDKRVEGGREGGNREEVGGRERKEGREE